MSAGNSPRHVRPLAPQALQPGQARLARRSPIGRRGPQLGTPQDVPDGFDEVIVAAGQLLADASRERDELAAAGGPRAVALAAHYPGHAMTVDEIEQYYRQLQDEARRRQE